MLRVVRVKMHLHWGFSIKHPSYSAAQPSFRVPPPTSLLGALAYAVNRSGGGIEVSVDGRVIYSSVANMLDRVLWITYRVEGLDPRLLLETRDISRISMIPYVRSDNVYLGSPNLWGIQVHGKIYSPALMIDTLYFVKARVAEEVAKVAWGITRVGTKESIASVTSVSIHEVTLTDLRDGETVYLLPRDVIKEASGDFVVVRLPSVSRDWYKLGEVRNVELFMKEYILPIKSVRASLSSNGTFVKVKGVGLIALPLEVVVRGND